MYKNSMNSFLRNEYNRYNNQIRNIKLSDPKIYKLNLKTDDIL